MQYDSRHIRRERSGPPRGGHHGREERTGGLQAPVADERLANEFKGAQCRVAVFFRAGDKRGEADRVRPNAGEAHPSSDRHALAVLHGAAEVGLAGIADVSHLGFTIEVEADAFRESPFRGIENTATGQQQIVDACKCGERLAENGRHFIRAGTDQLAGLGFAIKHLTHRR